MSAADDDEDEFIPEELEYFYEILEDADLTPYTPKFAIAEGLSLSPEQLQEMKVADLIKEYRALRDQLATERKAYKQREGKMKTQMGVISMVLRQKGDEQGVDNFKTDQGTAYRNRTEKIRVQNWDEFQAWMIETENWHLVQKRVSPNSVKEIRDAERARLEREVDHRLEGDALANAMAEAAVKAMPPGLLSVPEEIFAVRSPSASKKK